MILTKRQKEIFDYLRDYTVRHGYAPTLTEIGRRFELSSLATVHKHLKNLEGKRLIRREWNRSRAVEIVNPQGRPRPVEIPLLGTVAAGAPVEPLETPDTVALPPEWAREKDTFVLRVRGDSLIDEQIRDGDLIVARSSTTAANGATVIAMVNGETMVKRFFQQGDGRVRLQPANERLEPIQVARDQVEIRGVVLAVIRKY